MKRCLLRNSFLTLSLACAIATSLSAATTPQSLSLEECIHIAIENATTVLKAQNAVTVSGAEVLRRYAQFLPDLQASANYDYSRGRTLLTLPSPTTVSTRNFGPSYQLSSSINIFNGYSDYATMKAAIARKSANELSLSRAREQIAVDITQAFLQVNLDAELVTIARENVRVSLERQNLLTEQTRVGIKDLSDLYRQEAQTSSDEAALISIENKLRDDTIQLVRRLRLNTAQNYAFQKKTSDDKGSSLETLSEEALIAEALQQRTDFQASQKTLNAATWSISSAQSSYYPKINFNANLAGLGRNVTKQFVNGVDLTPNQQTNLWVQSRENILWDAGISLTWAIFDRQVTRYAVAQAAADKANALIDLEDEKLQVISDVRQAVGDLSAAKRRLEATEKGIQAAEKAYETVFGRYQVGAASFLDLISAQSVLVDSRSAKAQAQMDTLLQSRVLAHAVGIILLKN